MKVQKKISTTSKAEGLNLGLLKTVTKKALFVAGKNTVTISKAHPSQLYNCFLKIFASQRESHDEFCCLMISWKQILLRTSSIYFVILFKRNLIFIYSSLKSR